MESVAAERQALEEENNYNKVNNYPITLPTLLLESNRVILRRNQGSEGDNEEETLRAIEAKQERPWAVKK